jgi:hypothetical protein
MVSLPTRHTTRRATAVTLGMAKTFALQGSFRGRVRFHRQSEPTNWGEFSEVVTASNRHYKVRGYRAVLLGVVVAAPRAELHDPVVSYAKVF